MVIDVVSCSSTGIVRSQVRYCSDGRGRRTSETASVSKSQLISVVQIGDAARGPATDIEHLLDQLVGALPATGERGQTGDTHLRQPDEAPLAAVDPGQDLGAEQGGGPRLELGRQAGIDAVVTED